MTKKLLLAVVAVLTALLPQGLFAQAEIPLSESFEDGWPPEGWIVESDEGSGLSWFVERGDTSMYPAGATDGTMRAAFRNTTGIETHGRARLISPVFNSNDLTMPVLCFSHAAARWGGDFDTLYVKYRNVGQDDDRWIDLHRFAVHSNTWSYDTIDLQAWTDKYQIAFEAVDNLGRGVVIDNVVVRSKPQCEMPSTLLSDDLQANSAHLSWGGGFSQDGFHLKVSTVPLQSYELTDPESRADVIDTILSGSTFEFDLTGLKQGAAYYWYVRTICGNDGTEWAQGKEFRTPNTIAAEFTEDFNDATVGEMTHPENWYWGNSFGGNVPFINGHTDSYSLGSWSLDNSYSLIFGIDQNGSGEWGTFRELEAGAWAYIASPEILTEDIALLQVTFDIAFDTWSASQAEITVGVMTNPDDISTFTEVETVIASSPGTHTVQLGGYIGEGKHIAFMSRSEAANLLAIDNIAVSTAPTCPRASGIEAMFPSATEATVSWNGFGKAEGGQIVVSEGRISGEEIENADNVVAKFDATSIPFTIKDDTIKPGGTYYVYVRNKCGGTLSDMWCSEPLSITMPDTIQSVPKSRMNTIQSGEFTVLPELVGLDITTLELTYLGNGTVSVGVFDTVGILTSYTRVGGSDGANAIQSVRFDGYTGDGKFIAVQGNASDMELDIISNCEMPEGISVTPGDTYADFKWEAGDAAKWEIRVSESDAYANLDDPEYEWLANETVETPEYKVTGLEAGMVTYYYYIRTVCDADPENVTYSDWTYTASFATLCPAKNDLPYILDFDAMGDYVDIESCCFIAKEANNYPNIGYAYTDKQGYNLNLRTFASNASSDDNYVAFNEMNIDDVSDLVLTINLWNGSTNGDWAEDALEVGFLTEYGNWETFTPYTTIRSSEVRKWEEHSIAFTDYTGDGKYIALRVAHEDDASFCISKITVMENTGCVKVPTPVVGSVGADNATLSWRKSLETSWDILLSDYYLTTEQLAEATTKAESTEFPFTMTVSPGQWMADIEVTIFNLVKDVTVNTNYTLTDLTPNQNYYVYIRSVCADGEHGPWSNPTRFATTCQAMTPEEIGTLTFEVERSAYTQCETYPDCWNCTNTVNPEDWSPVITDEWSYEGDYSLKIGSEASTTDPMRSYAIMQELEVEDINNVEMTFYGSCGEVDYDAMAYYNACMHPQLPRKGQVIVGLTASVSDLSRVVNVDTIQGYKEWQKFTVHFDRYTHDDYGDIGRYVVFISDFDQNNVFYIDNISFRVIGEGECTAPKHIEIDSLATDYARIAWEGGEAPFTLKLAGRALSDAELNSELELKGVQTVSGIEDHSYELENLETATHYYCYVGCECGGEMQWSELMRFTTDCGAAMPIPYTEDFDAYTPGFGVVPACWTGIFTRYDQINKYPCIDNNGKTLNGLYVYTISEDVPSYAIMPAMDADITTLQLALDLKGDVDNYQRSLVAGVVTDLSSDITIQSSFIPVDTVIVNDSEYEHAVISFANTTPSAKAIVLTSSYNLNYHETLNRFGRSAGVYVDNIEVTAIGSCAKPEKVTVTSVTENTATIHIDGEAEQYAVFCGTTGSLPDAGQAETISTADHTLNISQPSDIYVSAMCGGENGLWYGPVSVTPLHDPLPGIGEEGTTDGFEGATDGWVLVNDGQANNWVIGTAQHNGESSTKALYVSGDNGTTAKYNTEMSSSVWAYRTMKLNPGLYTFTYDWLCAGDAPADYMRVGLLPVEYTFNSGSNMVMSPDGANEALSAEAAPSGWISLEGGKTPLAGQNAWSQSVNELIMTDQMAGTYNLVVYWENNNDGEGTAEPSAAIDNISISYEPCVNPINVKVSRVTHNTAHIEWEDVKIEGLSTQGFEIYVTADVEAASPEAADAEVFNKTYSDITECSADIDGLTGDTPLALFIRTHCSEEADDYSAWSEKVTFTTLCDPQPALYEYNFDNVEELTVLSSGWSSSTYAPNCFIRGNINGGTDANAPYVENNSSYGMSRSGQNALSLGGVSGASQSQAGGYIAMPLIDADLDNMQLTFWMRAMTTSGSSGGFYMSDERLQSAKTVTIGAMSDPNDPSTFEKITDCVYPYGVMDITSSTLPSDDPNGNEFWVKFIVPLNGYNGKHIVFLNDDYGQAQNYFYIDDVIIEEYTPCQPPTSIYIDKVTSDSAVISFEHKTGDRWLVEVSDQRNMSHITDSIEADSDVVSITGLQPNTTYYVGVRQLCDGQQRSDRSIVASFTTSYGLRFNETFGEDMRMPADWDFTNGIVEIDNLFEGTVDMISSIQTSGFEGLGWLHEPISEQMSAHNYMNCTGYTTPIGAYWMLSPTIYVREGESANLTLEVAVTLQDSYDPLAETDKIVPTSRFVVAVSDDEGKTWKRENAFIWSDDPDENADYKFSELTNRFQRFTLDLSKHMDKNIRIGMTTESRTDAIDFAVRVDNVIVNTMEVINIDTTACGNEDYVGYGFDIPFEEMTAGEVYTNERYGFSTTQGPDTLYKLNVAVSTPVVHTETASICEGTTYTEHGFNSSVSGTLTKRCTLANGCDSTFIVNLSVIPAKRELLHATICRGAKYPFNGRELTEAGNYLDTVPSLTPPYCDSIITLQLEVLAAEEHFDTVTICHDEEYQFGEQVLRNSGDYEEKFKQGECDSIVKLHLIVQPEFIDIKDVVICDGETYNDDVFKGLDETFSDTVTRQSVDGCDSIVGLNLVVIKDGETVDVERTISVDDLPFTYHGYTFDENTTEGTHTADINVTSQSGECSGVIHLTLHVGTPTYVDDVFAGRRSLTLTPNPVNVGDEITLGIDLTEAERTGATVAVYSTSGALVKSFAPGSADPITMQCYFSPGVYIIQLTCGTGEQYQGKIIVK